MRSSTSWTSPVLTVLTFAVPFVLLACASDEDEPTGDSPVGTYNAEYDKDLLDAPPDSGKEDGVGGIKGPLAITDGAATEVWAVRSQWEDRDTPEARKAGLVWGPDSGLSWSEKFALWVTSMQKIDSDSYFQTYELTTPTGVKLPSPVLECAETAVFLRVAFASWYGLPFYLTAWSEGSNLHLGHFGIWRDDGPDNRFANYRTRYTDYSDMPIEEALESWPSDEKLVGRKLSKSGDDENEWMGEGAYAGAYFDRIFLNKRVGHFLALLLTYTGSIHLASTQNTFNLKASAVRAGDTLLERWQKKGIGHTLVVKRVEPIEGTEYLEAELVSGSMPRRQGKWESPADSKSWFTNAKMGGEGTAYDGTPYAALGGGIKRWRIAKVVSGRWRNAVAEADTAVFVPNWNTEAIAARPAEFDELLAEATPEMMLGVLVARVEDKRMHLRERPASCSARISREEAFDELYALTAEAWGWTRAETDAKYRKLEDYVYAELVYEQSRTCCWNSTTASMHEAIMAYAETQLQDALTGACLEPPVFKMVDGGYAAFETHAQTAGIDWVSWSADESCPQADTVTTDTEAEHQWAPYCGLAEDDERG